LTSNKNNRITGHYVQVGESVKVFSNVNTNSFIDLRTDLSGLDIRDKEKVDLIFKKAEEQAANIILEAQKQAVFLMEQAKTKNLIKEKEIDAKIKIATDEGRQSGYNAGYEDGLQKATEDIFQKVSHLEAIAVSSFNIKKEIILSAEQEILQLSLAIAERVLKQQLEIKPEMIELIIKSAIMELKDKDEIKIFINPALKDQLYNYSEELKTTIKGLKVVKIIEDKTINPDSAIVESLESRIDARLESQVAEIAREIMRTFAEEPDLKDLIEQKNIK